MIQSAKRTLEIIEYIGKSGNLVRVNDIARALNLNNTTVHNFLKTLKDLGYVEQDYFTPKYRLTEKINLLAIPPISNSKLKETFRPILKYLAEESGETANLAIQVGNQFRYELQCEPNRSVFIVLNQGKEVELLKTATGKVFLAYSNFLLNTLNIIDKKILEELDEIKSQGYALDLENYSPNLNCIAIPVKYNNHVQGVVGLFGPAHRFNITKMNSWSERIINIISKLNI